MIVKKRFPNKIRTKVLFKKSEKFVPQLKINRREEDMKKATPTPTPTPTLTHKRNTHQGRRRRRKEDKNTRRHPQKKMKTIN